ncbi:hypothetical protein [Youxingia wuxianensis]|uniref:Uncharacterized protein n=1 Tax=Youxingia wuxianensis TaxID=2763678 RepID=A0A926IDA0_9FIRM|nr:hypothetical protein [Youxingia wuxianensis]MBC8586062.1 hypothetical protein [Youxingia wuxianensis]
MLEDLIKEYQEKVIDLQNRRIKLKEQLTGVNGPEESMIKKRIQILIWEEEGLIEQIGAMVRSQKGNIRF